MEENTANRPFRFSLKWLLILASVIGLCAGVTMRWLHRESERGWSVARLEHDIQSQSPPILDQSAAEAWFTARKIDHHYYPDPTGGYQVGTKDITTIAGLNPKNISGVVAGTIGEREANLGLFASSGRITVFFFIDHNGRCVAHWIEPFEYSL